MQLREMYIFIISDSLSGVDTTTRLINLHTFAIYTLYLILNFIFMSKHDIVHRQMM